MVIPDGDAVADAEARRIFHHDLLLVAIAIGGQAGLETIAGSKDGLAGDADDADVITEMEGVAHLIASGRDVDRTAAQASHIIDGRLKNPMVVAPQIAFDAHADLCLSGRVGRLGLVAKGDPECRKSGDECQNPWVLPSESC